MAKHRLISEFYGSNFSFFSTQVLHSSWEWLGRRNRRDFGRFTRLSSNSRRKFKKLAVAWFVLVRLRSPGGKMALIRHKPDGLSVENNKS